MVLMLNARRRSYFCVQCVRITYVKSRRRNSRKFCPLNASIYYSWNISIGATNLAAAYLTKSVVNAVHRRQRVDSIVGRNIRHLLCVPLLFCSAYPTRLLDTHFLYKARIKQLPYQTEPVEGRCIRHERIQSEVRNIMVLFNIL